MWRERMAVALLLLIVGGIPLALALPVVLPQEGAAGGRRVIEVVARAPEAGGWSLDEIVIPAGEPVRLRLRAEDVVHGFAVAHLGLGVEAIEPGGVYELDLLVERPGRYPFYCDVWCSPHHYRMRGTLVVVGHGGEAPELPVLSADPGVDPDAPHDAWLYPRRAPDAEAGSDLAAGLQEGWQTRVGSGRLFATESPEMLNLRLQLDFGLRAEEAWDLIAYLWQQQLDEEDLALGRQLYARNCAVCHGATGRGEGPAAAAQPVSPPAFTDLRRMAGATEAILGAKIARGGMGTGMPYWGRLFTEQELEALLTALWSFWLGDE